jgi:hypothetical protein
MEEIMADTKYESTHPRIFNDGYKVGEREAKQQLKKNEPKTTRGIIKTKNILKERLNGEHWLHHLEWRKGYQHGAYDTIMEYQKKLTKL